LAAGIARVKSAKSMGVRMGNWLSLKQAQALLNAPDITTTEGLRDRAIIAVLLGCGLRRSEVAALNDQPHPAARWPVVHLGSMAFNALTCDQCSQRPLLSKKRSPQARMISATSTGGRLIAGLA
jgi:site-specific recombinase XerD